MIETVSTRIHSTAWLPASMGLIWCLLSSNGALAQGGSAAPVPELGAAPASSMSHQPGIEQQFLRVESSLWLPYGWRLSKNGQTVGPEWFSVVPNEAVRGSKEAMAHARHARIYQGFTLGSVLAGVGLIVGGLAVADSHREWTRTARLLTAGGILAIFTEFVCALGREDEIMKSVNAYNYDLVKGKLGE